MNIKDHTPINENSELNMPLTLDEFDIILDENIISCKWNAPKARNGIFRVLFHLAECYDKIHDTNELKLAKLEGGEIYHCMFTREAIHYAMDRGHVLIMKNPINQKGFFPKEIWVMTVETKKMMEKPEENKKYFEILECEAR